MNFLRPFSSESTNVCKCDRHTERQISQKQHISAGEMYYDDIGKILMLMFISPLRQNTNTKQIQNKN